MRKEEEKTFGGGVSKMGGYTQGRCAQRNSQIRFCDAQQLGRARHNGPSLSLGDAT